MRALGGAPSGGGGTKRGCSVVGELNKRRSKSTG